MRRPMPQWSNPRSPDIELCYLKNTVYWIKRFNCKVNNLPNYVVVVWIVGQLYRLHRPQSQLKRHYRLQKHHHCSPAFLLAHTQQGEVQQPRHPTPHNPEVYVPLILINFVGHQRITSVLKVPLVYQQHHIGCQEHSYRGQTEKSSYHRCRLAPFAAWSLLHCRTDLIISESME